MKKEIEYFFAALRFFTRLPVPRWVGHTAEGLNQAARYFPLVGILVGAAGALATGLAALVWPFSLAILMGMATTILLTGAFHEDGLADSIDGFGGGWDKARILAIMKDSRVGSYGAIGVALMLLAKWNALMEVDPAWLPATLVAAHAASRFAAATLISFLDYVRDDDTSRSKPLVTTRMGGGALAVAAAFGLAPAVLLLPFPDAAAALTFAALATFLAARYFVRRIGGYTGDCLGATQQIAEIAFYLGLLCDFS